MFGVQSLLFVLAVLNQVYGGPVSSESQAMVLFFCLVQDFYYMIRAWNVSSSTHLFLLLKMVNS